MLLQARGIHKSYGPTPALRDVDFDVRAGAVNVLIGENGAGKSTLMRILAGVETPSAGALLLDGAPVAFGSVRDAARAGIGIVFQELNLCPNLTVAENIFLGRSLGRRGVIDRRAERMRAQALMARLAAEIDVDTPVGHLRIGQQQIVEIARALAEDVRVLILDEPTSALSTAEVRVLFGIIADLKAAGVGIVYISHRLEELIAIGDFVTILRDGQREASAPIAEVSIPWVVERMLGERGRSDGTRPPHTQGDVVLELADATVLAPSGAVLVDHVNAAFHAGEVTAIYGLLGAGRTELLEYLSGARAGRGAVRLHGEDIAGLSLAERVERRLLLLVPEDRQREGLFGNLDVGGNLGLAGLGRFAKGGVIAGARERGAVARMMQRLGVKASSPATPIGALSGGNQQKVVIGRCLLPGPAAILLDEPSRGVDIGARADIFRTMRALATEGLAIVFVTSDVAEALAVADRILVMAAGALVADHAATEVDEATLVRAANSRQAMGAAERVAA